jgi:hypothetical protein
MSVYSVTSAQFVMILPSAEAACSKFETFNTELGRVGLVQVRET